MRTKFKIIFSISYLIAFGALFISGHNIAKEQVKPEKYIEKKGDTTRLSLFQLKQLKK